MTRAFARPLGAFVVVVAASALVGCGSEGFTAEELVAEINRNGGELALGERLGDAEEGPELHTLSFTGAAPTPEDVHAGGSLLIAGDDDEALAEYRRCEGAASLICFRVANAVLMFEGAVQEADLVRLSQALRAMSAD